MVTNIVHVFGMTTLDIMGQPVRRKQGVINEVDQNIDSFNKVVILISSIFLNDNSFTQSLKICHL